MPWAPEDTRTVPEAVWRGCMWKQMRSRSCLLKSPSELMHPSVTEGTCPLFLVCRDSSVSLSSLAHFLQRLNTHGQRRCHAPQTFNHIRFPNYPSIYLPFIIILHGEFLVVNRKQLVSGLPQSVMIFFPLVFLQAFFFYF